MPTNGTTKTRLPLAHAVPQKPLPPISISVKELVAERKRFKLPNYQREQVWKTKDKQQFIDSLLLGDPFAPVEGYERFQTEGPKIGEKYWEIGDGQNRIDAIIGFALGEFKTWTARQKAAFEPTSQVGPVEANRWFDDLSQIAKNYLLDYHVRIDLLHDRPESEKIARFLRVQTHVPLRKAERLNAFLSKAKDAAKRIEKDQFWKDFYGGDRKRKQIFQNSLYLLALEISPDGIQDLQAGGYIDSLVSGRYDDDITDELVEDVLARLNLVAHVYEDTHFTVRATSVIMYQSILFLEQVGYDIRQGDKGKLTPWIESVMADSKRSTGTASYHRPIQQLTSAKAQQEFWNRNIRAMMGHFGLNIGSLDELYIKKTTLGEKSPALPLVK